jgi:hypothetical protein
MESDERDAKPQAQKSQGMSEPDGKAEQKCAGQRQRSQRQADLPVHFLLTH